MLGGETHSVNICWDSSSLHITRKFNYDPKQNDADSTKSTIGQHDECTVTLQKQNNIQLWVKFQYSSFHSNRHRWLKRLSGHKNCITRNGTIIKSFPGYLFRMSFTSPSRWEGPLPRKSCRSFFSDKWKTGEHCHWPILIISENVIFCINLAPGALFCQACWWEWMFSYHA